MIKRPTVSATSTKSPPSKAATGKLNSCFEPTNCLARCGAIYPTKLILPLTDTLAPASATADPSKNNRSLSIEVPKPIAC